MTKRNEGMIQHVAHTILLSNEQSYSSYHTLSMCYNE